MSKDTLKVVEIFTSIEGEGIRAGYPCVFVRFAGCNLKCKYCDTCYAQDSSEGMDMTIKDIVNTVHSTGINKVTLTGGEPMLQKNLMHLVRALIDKNLYVNIETNGSILIPGNDRDLWYRGKPDHLIFTIDYKSPSSEMNPHMCLESFYRLASHDVLKFVVGSKEDMLEAWRVLQVIKPDCNVFFSPIFGDIEPAEIVDFLKDHYLNNARVQLQIHKIIWNPDKRGV